MNAHRNFGAVPEPGELTEGDTRAPRRGRARIRRRSASTSRTPASAPHRRGDGDERAREPVRRRPGAVVAREDRPRPRRDRALRRAARVDSLKTLLHAVPPVQLAGAARAARLRRAGSPARSSSAPSRRRTAPRTRCSPATTRAGSAPGRRASCRRARRCASRGRSSASSTPEEVLASRAPRDRHARAPRPRSRTPTRRSRVPPRPVSRGSSPSARRRRLPPGALARRAHDGVFAILGIHPHDAGARPRTTRGDARAARASEGGRRRGRRGSTGSATTRRATSSCGSSPRSSSSPPSSASRP